MQQRTRRIALLGCLSVTMMALYGRIDFRSAQFEHWDLWSYQAMAEAAPGLSSQVARPFAYRLLGPYLVGLLPLPTSAGFYIATIATALGLTFLFYGLLRKLAFDPTIAMLGTSLFLFNRYFFGFVVWDYFQLSDILSFTFLVLLWWSMLAGRWGPFALLLALGVLSRETVWLMIPVAFVHLWESGAIRAQWKAAAVSITPALLIAVLLRLFVQADGGLSVIQAFFTIAPRKVLQPESWISLVAAFLPLSILPMIFHKVTFDFFRRRKHAAIFAGLVVGSTLLGRDNARLMAPSFIVFYPLIASILQIQRGQRVWIGIIMASSFAASFHHIYGLVPLPGKVVTEVVSAAALALVTTSALFVRSSARTSP